MKRDAPSSPTRSRPMNSSGPNSSGPTHWGAQWLRSLETSSDAYSGRFRSSGALARRAAVLDLDTGPGHVSARVVDKRGEIHRVDLAVRLLVAGEWDDLIVSVATRSGTLAALLDGELTPSLLAQTRAIEVELFPGPSDLRPDCSCEDWSEPCVHAGAVIYELAGMIDADPFVLFTIRGLGREGLVDAIGRLRNSPTFATDPLGHTRAPASTGPTEDPGRSVEQIWAGWSDDVDLGPAPVFSSSDGPRSEPVDGNPVTPEPASHVLLTELSATGSGGILGDTRSRSASSVHSSGSRQDLDHRLQLLAADAVARALEALHEGSSLMLGSRFEIDLARRAAALESDRDMADLARRIGWKPDVLGVMAEAWRRHGEEAVLLLVDPAGTWVTNQEELATARDELVARGARRSELPLNYNSLGVGRNEVVVLAPSHQWFLLARIDSGDTWRIISGPAERITQLQVFE